MAIKTLQIKCKRLLRNSADPTKLRFVGYSGGPVNLSDHNLKHPVYYDLATMTVAKKTTPMMYNHRTEVGHTLSLDIGNDLKGTGVLSVKNKASERIKNATEAEFPYEASIGLDVDTVKIFTVTKGTVEVNGRVVNSPCHIVKNCVLKEISVCPLGRDGNTSVTLFNSSDLKTINNNRLKDDPMPKKRVLPPETKVRRSSGDPVRRPVRNRHREPVRNHREEDRTPADDILDSMSATQMADIMELQADHPEHGKLIANGLRRGYSVKQIKNKMKLVDLENGMYKPPAKKGEPQDDLEARFVSALCSKPEETLKKVYGEKTSDRVMNMPQIELREVLLNGAARLGGRFTGFSDVENMISFIGKANRGLIRNGGFSTFDFPEFFKRSATILLEEAWKIENATFAQEMCIEESNNTFNPEERYRPSGGEMWESLTDDGRIKHTTFGKSKRYVTTLDTKAQLLVLPRPVLINNNMDVVKQMYQLMIEGSIIIPDYKLINRMWQPNGTFFVSNVNDFTLALTDANLSTIYAAARTYAIDKGKISWLNAMSEKWILLHGPSLAKTAFDLLQVKFVGNTTANTRQGQDNFWTGKITTRELTNLGNTTINANAQADAWFLWPVAPRFAPWTLTYLRGQKKPTIRSVEVDNDILGVAMQGFLDVEVNDREPAAIFRSRPTGTITGPGTALA